MELVQLQLVKEILETGSLSKAAMRLNRAQSVVSRQLAALERECGGRIFYRNGRGVLLTELGQSMLPQIELILATASDIAGRSAALKNQIAGEVRIATTPSVGPNLIGPLFTKLSQTHPQIRLSVSEPYSCEIESDLQEGRTDVAVFLRNGANVGREDRVICEMDTYLVGLPDALPVQRETIPFSAIDGLPLLMPSAPSACRRSIDDIAASKGVKLSLVAEVNAPGPTHALLHAGAGYLITPLGPGPAVAMSLVGADVRAKRLRAARIVEPSFTRTLVVSTGVNPTLRVETVARQTVATLRQIIGAPQPELKPLALPGGLAMKQRPEQKVAMARSN